MKKIFFFILIVISVNGFAQTGFPGVQSMANANTRLIVNGGLQATRGLINGVFTDTTAANSDYIDFYNGAQIYTRSDRNFWLRDSVLNQWIRMAKYSETIPNLTATQIAYGDGSNKMTSEAALNYDAIDNVLSTYIAKTNHVFIADWNSIGTPPANYVGIFSDSHGIVYSKNDAGTISQLTNESGTAQKFHHPTGDFSMGEDRYGNYHGLYSHEFDSIGDFRINLESTLAGPGRFKIRDILTGNDRFIVSTTGIELYSPDLSRSFKVGNNAHTFSGLEYSDTTIYILGINETTGEPYKTLKSSISGGGGTNNTNVGSGFRLVVPSTQEIKTLFNGYAVKIDSSSNTDGLTFKADTALLTTTASRQKLIDSLQAKGWGAIALTANNTETWINWWRDNKTNAPFTISGAGAGAGITGLIASTFDGWAGGGIYETGTTTTGRICLYWDIAGNLAPIAMKTGIRYNYEEVTRFEDLSDGTETFNYFCGFSDGATKATIIDGVFFSYKHSDSSGKWVCNTISNSTQTAVASSITVAADTDYQLDISVFGGNAYFYIDKVLVATISTNIPLGTSRLTSIVDGIEKEAGTTSRKVYVKKMGYGEMTQ